MRTMLVFALLAACGCRGEPERSPLPDAPDAAPESTAAPAPEIADTLSGFDAAGQWRLTASRVGSIEFGVSFAEALPHLEAGIDTTSIADGCEYVRSPNAPPGVTFMVEQRRVVRADVREGDATTPEGAKVGDEEQRILELYPTARRMPHKYTDGSYLIVMPFAPSDTLRRYVFETDGHRVTSFRAGLYPPVEYVEGCA